MEVLLVYESVSGLTHRVAEAVADGVRSASSSAHVTVAGVGDVTADQVAAADLLVVGGPTHMRGMSTERTRHMGVEGEQKSAAAHGDEPRVEPGAEGPGLRDWFDALPRQQRRTPAAAFDTSAGFWLAGGARHGISRRLRRHGYEVVAEEAFEVEGDPIQLKPGQLDRARDWGAALQRRLEAAST
ncbi:MAG: flavodoxin family protein [Actinomycetota bacterium]